jgi:hypothetical protein
MFIKHVLGVDQKHNGIYEDISAYYGTVEEQGQLALHLHLLLWIRSGLTPQEIRDRIMNDNSEFQKKLIEYLEGLCVGQFITGTKDKVSEKLAMKYEQPNHRNPTTVLPKPPPECVAKPCENHHQYISQNMRWWGKFKETVDDLLMRLNLHNSHNGQKTHYCFNSKGECKWRFPRDTFEQSSVDPSTGTLIIKKLNNG